TLASDASARAEAAARHDSRGRVDADAGQGDAMKAGDSQLEIMIGRVLRLGVVTSTVCLAIGLSLALAQAYASPVLLNSGILLLIAYPAALCAMSMVEYAIAKDRTFLILTSIVLLELIGGAVAALVFHRKI